MKATYVMHEERRIGGRVVQIGTSVSTDGVVATAMNTDRAWDEVLEEILEALDVCTVLEKKGNLLICGLTGSLLADITAQTTRIVSKTVSLRVRFDPRKVVLKRPHVDLPAMKMSVLPRYRNAWNEQRDQVLWDRA